LISTTLSAMKAGHDDDDDHNHALILKCVYDQSAKFSQPIPHTVSRWFDRRDKDTGMNCWDFVSKDHFVGEREYRETDAVAHLTNCSLLSGCCFNQL